MGLYLSIPLLPGIRLGGRLTPRRRRRRPVRKRRGVGLFTFLLIAVGYTLAAEVILAVLAAALGAAVLWLMFVLARFAILTVLNRPVQTPRDAIRQGRFWVGARYGQARDAHLRVRDAYRRNRNRNRR